MTRATMAAILLAASLLAIPAPAWAARGDTGIGMYFADAKGHVTPTLFSDPANPMGLAECKARLNYLTKKFYRMVRNNMHEFDGMKLVKSACVAVDTFQFGSK